MIIVSEISSLLSRLSSAQYYYMPFGCCKLVVPFSPPGKKVSTDDAPELCGRAGDMVASTALQSQGFAVTIDDSKFYSNNDTIDSVHERM